jgi:hypothetical protein
VGGIAFLLVGLVGLVGLTAACGPSLSSLARDTFFHGYDCPKSEIQVTGGGGNVPYEATGCGKHASFLCHSENGSMGCEEVGRPPSANAPPPSSAPAAPSATAAAPSSSLPAHP